MHCSQQLHRQIEEALFPNNFFLPLKKEEAEEEEEKAFYTLLTVH